MLTQLTFQVTKMKFLVPAVLATLLITILCQEITITPLPNNSGLLPLKLGKAYINNFNHVLLHYVDLEFLLTNFSRIEDTYDSLILHGYNKGILPDEYLDKSSEYNILINSIGSKFDNILYYNKRVKRGLFNFLGSTNKFLFGNLDADDGERINEMILKLERNQNKIVQHANIQISLSKQLVERYNETITKLNTNQLTLVNKFKSFEKAQNKNSNWISYHVLFDQIITNLRLIDNFLKGLENAITFAKLGTLHPDIITIGDLREIFRLLSHYYAVKELIQTDFSSLYSIIETRAYTLNNKVIFALSIPIVQPKQFDYYKLIPIPINQTNILIPPFPYLILDEEIHQFHEKECRKLTTNFICTKEEHFVEDNCIVPMIRGHEPSGCRLTPIEIQESIIEKISSELAIVIAIHRLQLKETCTTETQIRSIEGNQLIKIPINCKIQYKNEEIGNFETKTYGKPLLVLPDIKMPSSPKDNKIKLKKIRLEDLHQIQKQIEATHQLKIEDIYHPSTSDWKTWTIAVILILLICFIIVKLPKIAERIKLAKKKKIVIVDAVPMGGGVI